MDVLRYIVLATTLRSFGLSKALRSLGLLIDSQDKRSRFVEIEFRLTNEIMLLGDVLPKAIRAIQEARLEDSALGASRLVQSSRTKDEEPHYLHALQAKLLEDAQWDSLRALQRITDELEILRSRKEGRSINYNMRALHTIEDKNLEDHDFRLSLRSMHVAKNIKDMKTNDTINTMREAIIEALHKIDVSMEPSWKSFAARYHLAEPFKIDADPAFVHVGADDRFSTRAKLLFSFERTNSLQIPVNVSGYAPAVITGKLRANGTVHLEEFEVTDD